MYEQRVISKDRLVRILVGAMIAIAMIASGILVYAQTKQAKATATAEQATACINAAVAARPGGIDDLDIDRKAGKVVCKVGIVGTDGKEYDVSVDLADNKVISNVEDH